MRNHYETFGPSRDWYRRHRRQLFSVEGRSRAPEECIRALQNRIADNKVSIVMLTHEGILNDEGELEWRKREIWWLARMGLMDKRPALLPIDELKFDGVKALKGSDIRNDVLFRGAVEYAFRGYHTPLEQQTIDCRQKVLDTRKSTRAELEAINRETPWQVRSQIRDELATATYTRDLRVADQKRHEQRLQFAELAATEFYDRAEKTARTAA